MRVVVCAKLIPDPSAPPSLDSSFNLDRSGNLVVDDADTYGVEMALQLAEQEAGGEVIVVTMSPADDVASIRGALAMGATRAVAISGEALRGSDALSTAKVLASVIGPLSPDVVVCATESSDGYTGTVPVQVAEILGLPSVTFAKSVRVEGQNLRIERQTEEGHDEVELSTPCVVTVTAGVNVPRYASFKGIMAAKSKTVEVIEPRTVIDEELIGRSGARQEVIGVDTAPSRSSGEILTDDGEGSSVADIVQFLESAKVI